ARQAGHRHAVLQLAATATAATGAVAAAEGDARERRIPAQHHVVGAGPRRGETAALGVTAPKWTAVIGRRGRLRTPAHVEVKVSAAAAGGDVEVGGAGGNGDRPVLRAAGAAGNTGHRRAVCKLVAARIARVARVSTAATTGRIHRRLG